MAKVESDNNRPHIGKVLVRSSDPDRIRFRVKAGSAIVFCPKEAGRTALVVVDTGNHVGLSTGGHAALEIAAERYMGRSPCSRKAFISEYFLVRASIDPVTVTSPTGVDRKGLIFSTLGMSSLDSTRLPGAEYAPPDTLFANKADRQLMIDALNTKSRRHLFIGFRTEAELSSDQLVAQAYTETLTAGGIRALLHRYDYHKPDHLRRISD